MSNMCGKDVNMCSYMWIQNLSTSTNRKNTKKFHKIIQYSPVLAQSAPVHKKPKKVIHHA